MRHPSRLELVTNWQWLCTYVNTSQRSQSVESAVWLVSACRRPPQTFDLKKTQAQSISRTTSSHEHSWKPCSGVNAEGTYPRVHTVLLGRWERHSALPVTDEGADVCCENHRRKTKSKDRRTHSDRNIIDQIHHSFRPQELWSMHSELWKQLVNAAVQDVGREMGIGLM